MASEKLVLKAKGIYSNTNSLSGIPDGGLLDAENVVIDKDDVVELRRGFQLFGEFFGATGSSTSIVANQLMNYDDRIYIQYEPTDDTGYLEYQTTQGGTGFDTLLELKMLFPTSLTGSGTVATFTSSVDHNVLVGETVVIDGATGTSTVYNGTFIVATVPSSTQFTYSATGALPSVAEGSPVLVESTANDIIDPSENFKVKNVEANSNLYFTTLKGVKKIDSYNATIVSAGQPKALDIELAQGTTGGSGFFTDNAQVGYRALWGITDANDNLLLGTPSSRAFFTNASGGTNITVNVTLTIPEGITPSHFFQIYRTSLSVDQNTPPPEDYKLVYEGNATYTQIDAGTVSVEDITPEAIREGAVELYTNTNQEGDAQSNDAPPFAKDIALFQGMTFYANTKTNHTLPIALVGLDPIQTGPSASTLIVSNGTSTFTLTYDTSEDISTGKVELFTSGSVAQNIEDTAKSLVRVINRYASNSLIYAYYVSAPNDSPGKIILQSRHVTDGPFTVQATNSTDTDSFNNVISAYVPTLITATASANETRTNRIYYSKKDQPEAVPLLNFQPVGGGTNRIDRIIALRDSLFIFSRDGIYRITGTTPSSVSLALFDGTTKLVATESIGVGNNQIFGFTDEGISRVSETGIDVMSRQIENQLLPLLNPAYVGFTSATYGVFYQTDRKYIVFTVTEQSDEVATRAFVFNIFTNSWVKWELGKNCALVNTYDDKLYLGPTDTNRLEQERKNFDYTDHADRQHDVTVLQVSNLIVAATTGSTTTITAYNHGLATGNEINIVDCDAVPSLNDRWTVNVIDTDTFIIDTPITTAGTSGTWEIAVGDQIPIVMKLNSLTDVSVGDVILQTQSRTVNSTTFTFEEEATITEVDTTGNLITISGVRNYIVGDATIYNHFDALLTWPPIHGGDPGILKQFPEVHVMFDQFKGSDVQLDFSSEIQPDEDTIDFDLLANGSWGNFPWGTQPWGGDPGSKNIRTYVPRGKQRCRLLSLSFRHEAAREQFKFEGLSVVVRGLTARTNREQ